MVALCPEPLARLNGCRSLLPGPATGSSIGNKCLGCASNVAEARYGSVRLVLALTCGGSGPLGGGEHAHIW